MAISYFYPQKNLILPKGRAWKLCPKFVGPYRVAEAYPSISMYTLELPTALQEHRIVPMFHVSLLRLYHASDNVLFPNTEYTLSHTILAQQLTRSGLWMKLSAINGTMASGTKTVNLLKIVNSRHDGA